MGAETLLPYAGMIADQAGSYARQQEQNAANIGLARYQFSRNVDMWRMNNEYNAPAAQMERLRAAGLNPNLVYGSGSVTGNSSSNAPRFEAPRMEYHWQPLNAMSNLNMYQDLKMKEATINNIQKEGRLKDLEADIRNLEIIQKGLQNNWLDSTLGARIMESKGKGGYWDNKAITEAWNKNKTYYDWQKNLMSFNLLRDTYDSQVARTQSQAREQLLNEAMTRVDKNWQKAEYWVNNISKGLNSFTGMFGVSKLGGLMKRQSGRIVRDFK